MFKLYVALAFLAVAAAKPSWPLPYSGYPAVYPYNYGYPAPIVKTVVAPAIAPAPIIEPIHPYHIAPLGLPAGVIADPLLPYNAGLPLFLKKK